MIVPNKIIPGSQVADAATTYYTSPANVKTLIKKLTFTNTSAAAVKVTVYLVPSGDAAGNANCLRKEKTVASNETWECYEAENHLLAAGDTIQALADTAASVTVQATGVQITQ